MTGSRTNNTQISYSYETAPGVAGTIWEVLEVNDIGTFGPTTTAQARSPITSDRQDREPTLVDLDSAAEFPLDLTMSAIRALIGAYLFVNGINSNVTNIPSSGVSATGYTVAALTAAQADKFEIDTLLWANGFTNFGNNGLKNTNADIATAATEITVNGGVTAEPIAPADARVSIAGRRIPPAAAATWVWDGANAQAVLTFTGAVAALQALGLTPGQFVHVGSLTQIGQPIQNALSNLAANDMLGYARVRSFSGTDSVILDKVDPRLQFDDTPTTPVDLIFGEFFRNVPVTSAEFREQTFTFEAEVIEGDNDINDTYEYSIGNYANTLAIELPLTSKSLMTANFFGLDTEPPVTAPRRAGAATARLPFDTAAFSTTPDIARIRLADVDDEGLTTFIKNLTININNNMSGEKVLGVLGAQRVNYGNFQVNLEGQALFTNPALLARIRNNTTITAEVIIANDDGVIAVDFPSLKPGDGAREYTINETIKINFTGGAFRDPLFGTSIGISLSPVPIPTE